MSPKTDFSIAQRQRKLLQMTEMIGDVSVLGEVSSKLRNLSLWCDAQFSGALTVDLTGSSTFLPSWVFSTRPIIILKSMPKQLNS